MTATDLKALHDSDEHDTKEELVVFDNVLARYSPGDGITVGYSLGSRVCPTPVDWIGIFGSECRDTRRPVTFQWVPVRSTDSQCPQHRSLTFPRRLVEPLQHPTDSYRLMYVHKQRVILGVSPPFLVHEITINHNPQLRSPTSAGAETTAFVDSVERAEAVLGGQTVAASINKSAPKQAERATVETTYPVTDKRGEPAPAETGERASASGYAVWNTMNSHRSVSPDVDWGYRSVGAGHRRSSAFTDLSEALALSTRPCMDSGLTHATLEATGSEIAHVNAGGPNGMLQTDYSQHWRCRQPRETSGRVWESNCDSPTCRGKISARFLVQNNRPLDIFLHTQHLTSIPAQQQQVSNTSTQPQQHEIADTATEQHQKNIDTLTQHETTDAATQHQLNIDTSTQTQQTFDISIQPQHTTYTCLQKHQPSSVTQTISQKLGVESASNLMSLTLLQQSSIKCDGRRVQPGKTSPAHCSQDNSKDNTNTGEGILSIPATAPSISTSTPEECWKHQQARPTIPTHEIILRYLNNDARLAPRTHEDTQCKDTSLDNELAENAVEDAKGASIAFDLKNTHGRQQQQQQMCVPEGKHGWSLQKHCERQEAQPATARPHLKASSHRTGQVVTAGRGLSLYQKIRLKKRRKKPLHAEPGTKLNFGALLASRRGQATDTTTAVSEKPVTVFAGLLTQNGLDQDGQHLTHSKIWETSTQGVLGLRLSEVSDSSVQPLISVQSADATSRNRPSSQAHDTATRSTDRDPEPKPGEHPHSTTLQCAVGRVLNAQIYSRDLEMPAARQAHINIKKDTGMSLKYQATASLKDIKTQKELQNSFMREVQNLHDKPDGDSNSEPRRHVSYSGIAAHGSHSAESRPACSDLSTCAPCDSERLHVDPSGSDNKPQSANHRESQENSQGPSENFSVEAICCAKLAGRDDRLAEKDNRRDSLSWPLPDCATMPSFIGPWATQKKMKYQPENYTKHELPLEADSHHSQQPFKVSRTAGLEPGESVWGASGDIHRHFEQIAAEAEKTPRAVVLYGALMTSLTENMQLRQKLELVQLKPTEQTVRPQREDQTASARRFAVKRRPEASIVRHRRLPLVKYAGAIKNSVRCQEQILSLKSKVKNDDLLIRELNSQLTILKDALNMESRKVERAHHKLLKLKKKIKEYKEKMAALTRRQQMTNIDTPMEADQKARSWIPCLGDGDCRSMEPPLKKPRIVLESDAYMKDGTEAAIHPAVSEVVSVWKQQLGPPSQANINPTVLEVGTMWMQQSCPLSQSSIHPAVAEVDTMWKQQSCPFSQATIHPPVSEVGSVWKQQACPLSQATIHPPVSEVGSMWKQQSCPLSQDADIVVRRLPADETQVTTRAFTNVPSQHSTSKYTRNSTMSAFCHGSGFVSAFNANQQTAPQSACINAWSKGHLDAVVTPCHHNIIASCVRPVGSHRDKLPETDHKQRQQLTSKSCSSSQTWTRGYSSSECYTGYQSPTSSPTAVHCCSSSRQCHRAKPSCPGCYDTLASATQNSAVQQHRSTVHCEPALLPVMFTRFPQRSPLSCNNSRNKSRESSASDCQHISPLPSPCLLPLPESQNHWSGRGRRSSPRNEIVVDIHDTLNSRSSSQHCVNSYVGESVQPCSHHASVCLQDGIVTDQYDTNLYWPSTPAQETENYRHACAVYNLPDGGATRKQYSCAVEAGSMVKVHTAPFHVSPTSVESEQFRDNMFAYASGATVCPDGNSVAKVSDSVCKLLTAADDEGINTQLLGIFTTPQQVTHLGQEESTMLHNVSASLISAEDLRNNSMYSHFQSCFLSHFAKQDNHKLQNTRLQSQDPPRLQNTQLQSQDLHRLQNTQLQSHDPPRLQNTQLQSQDPLRLQNTQLQSQDHSRLQNTQLQSQDPPKLHNTQLQSHDPLRLQNTQLQSQDPLRLQNTQLQLQVPPILQNTQLQSQDPPRLQNTQFQSHGHLRLQDTQLQSQGHLKLQDTQLQSQDPPRLQETQLQSQGHLKLQDTQLQSQGHLRLQDTQLQSQGHLKLQDTQLQSQDPPRLQGTQLQSQGSPRLQNTQLQSQDPPRLQNTQLQSQDSPRLQNTQLQSQGHLRLQNTQLQSQDPPRLQETQLQSHGHLRLQDTQLQLQDPPRLLGHKHYRQRQCVQKACQSQPRPQKVYRYPRTPLSLPPSELPYPPLSPFHHATSTQVRKTSGLMLSDTDVGQRSNSILSEPALLQRLPHSAFHGSHHSPELPASSGMKHDHRFAIRRLLENPSSRDNPRSLVDLRTQSVRHVLNESALLASEALVESQVDDRQIEASTPCQMNPLD